MERFPPASPSGDLPSSSSIMSSTANPFSASQPGYSSIGRGYNSDDSDSDGGGGRGGGRGVKKHNAGKFAKVRVVVPPRLREVVKGGCVRARWRGVE